MEVNGSLFHGSERSELRQNLKETEACAAHTCAFKHALCFCKDNLRPLRSRGNVTNLCQSAVPILSSQPAKYTPSFPVVRLLCPFLSRMHQDVTHGLGTARHPIMHFTAASRSSDGGECVLRVCMTVQVWTAEVHQNLSAYCEILPTDPERVRVAPPGCGRL